VLARVQAKPPSAVPAAAWTRAARDGLEVRPFARCEGKETTMLRIYSVMLEMVQAMRPVIASVAKRDASLADQMRRAVQSIVLNTAEGMGSCGGNRRVRYCSALGSAREALACVQCGVALGYVDPLEEEMARRFDRVIGTLVKLTV
jgi:four helix bundle protein